MSRPIWAIKENLFSNGRVGTTGRSKQIFLISHFSFQSCVHKRSRHPRPPSSPTAPPPSELTTQKGGREECQQNWVRMGECRRGEQCMCSETDPVSSDPRPCKEKGGGVKYSLTWSQNLDDKKPSPPSHLWPGVM